MAQLTRTQLEILTVLADGKPHRRAELAACLPGESERRGALNSHLVAIRKALAPRGQIVLCQLLHKAIHYRWVALIGQSASEARQNHLPEVTSSLPGGGFP